MGLIGINLRFFGIPSVRQALFGEVVTVFRKVMPEMSQTEQAIDAGTVWWDGEIFSGNPVGTNYMQ